MIHIHACSGMAEIAAERDRLKADNENMLMNLAACSTYAIGYAIDEPTPGMVPRRAAADDVMKLWKKYDHLRSLAQGMAEALNKIRCSSPCNENHMSFNTPEQICDQRIAKDALALWDAFEKGIDK